MKVSMPHTGRRQEQRGRAQIPPRLVLWSKAKQSFRPKITLYTKQEANNRPVTPRTGWLPGYIRWGETSRDLGARLRNGGQLFLLFATPLKEASTLEWRLLSAILPKPWESLWYAK